MKKKHQTMLNIRAIILSIFLLSTIPALSCSASQVSGHYTSSSGKQISLIITVGSPPPKSIIVTQKLPAGTYIIKATPPYTKLKKKRNEAKWLFNGVTPGVITILMDMNKAVTRGEIKATLQFRDNQTGRINDLTIAR